MRLVIGALSTMRYRTLRSVSDNHGYGRVLSIARVPNMQLSREGPLGVAANRAVSSMSSQKSSRTSVWFIAYPGIDLRRCVSPKWPVGITWPSVRTSAET
jgi:hypothetical protein